jgi:TolB-like protein
MELERLVNKAMAKRPEDRYQHMDDLLVDLKRVERELATSDGSKQVSGVRDTSPVTGKSPRKRMGFVVGIGIPIAVVIIIAVIFSQRGGDLGGRSDGAKAQSLAVLPFDNLMDDSEQDYFVEGIHDALITGLSKLGSLRVISRTSVMRYKNTGKSLPEIARELDVDALIEGSVLRLGDEVRITAQLVDGTSDEHLWADSYDRDVRNVFSLLNEVAGAIAEEVQATLTPEQEERLARARPVDPNKKNGSPAHAPLIPMHTKHCSGARSCSIRSNHKMFANRSVSSKGLWTLIRSLPRPTQDRRVPTWCWL